MSYKPNEAGGGATLRFNGVFDYDELCRMILRWLHDRHYEVTEGTHKHKMSCPHGFEIERKIAGYVKVNEFIKYEVTFALHLWDAHKVDVVKDGKKIKSWKARIEITSSMAVIVDYQNRWDTPFKLKLLRFFSEYIIKKDLLINHIDPLWYKVYGFHQNIQKFLGMSSVTKVY